MDTPQKKAALQIALNLLIGASEKLSREYIQLPIAEKEDPDYRERVYCYELYHYIRESWPCSDEWPYSLSGEVDKAGHPLIRGNILDNVKPDLIFHVPGVMEYNLLAIEVKPINAISDRIKIDLSKLTAFCRYPACYYKACYLFYGADLNASEKIRLICRKLAEESKEIDLDTIQLMIHGGAGTSATCVDW